MQQKILRYDSQYIKGCQSKNASIAASTCFPVVVQRNLRRGMKVMSRDKIRCRTTEIVALLGVSTCRATSIECLRHVLISLRQSTTFPSMRSNHVLCHILNIARPDTFNTLTLKVYYNLAGSLPEKNWGGGQKTECHCFSKL